MARALTITDKIPYYVVKNGRAYWDPRKPPAGLGPRPLGPDGVAARERALHLYYEMKKARRDARGPFLTAPNARVGHVYFLATATHVKIGFSTHPVRRIEALKTGFAEEIISLVIVRGSRTLEARLHAHFAGARTSGEWFRKTDRLRDAMAKAAAGRLAEDGDF